MDGCADSEGCSAAAATAGSGDQSGEGSRGTRRGKGSGREPGERRWKGWLERTRARGTSEMELVVELHLCRGLSLPKVAEVLGVKLPVAQKLWRRGRAGVLGGVSAPKSKAEAAALREQVGMALWETVEATFLADLLPEASTEAKAKRRPPMLGVRINALRQIARLYDVDPKAKPKAEACQAAACWTPEEIAARVRERLKERRGGEEW